MKEKILPKSHTQGKQVESFIDIGWYIGEGSDKEQLTDAIKVKIMNEHWVPDMSFDMLYSVRKVKGREEKHYL